MKGILKKKRIRLAVLLFVLVLAVVFTFVARHLTGLKGEAVFSSCANHTVQLKHLMLSYADRHEHFPEGTNARTAVAEMNDAGEWPPDYAASYGSACPESFLRDKSIGYVHVGSGLPTKVQLEQPPLVFFCPADSHQALDYMGFAVMGDRMRYGKSNAEMISLLRAEIERAKSGSVPYSVGAQSLMQHELGAREKHESK